MKSFGLTGFLILLLLSLEGSGCHHFPYSFNGGRVFDDSVTVSVMTFTNNAPLAKATLPQTMTEALKDALQKQTRLQLVTKNGDLNYEGSITGYSVAPVSIQAGGATDQAAMNRLTISVSVKYTDGVDDKYSFESTFSRYSDYQSSQNLPAVEDQLIADITDQIVQDIMNKSINAW